MIIVFSSCFTFQSRFADRRLSGFPVYGCLYSGILIKTYSCSSDGYRAEKLQEELKRITESLTEKGV